MTTKVLTPASAVRTLLPVRLSWGRGEVFNLILNKQHLTLSGLQKIVEKKATMNLGLSDSLQAAFPGITSQIRPLTDNLTVIEPEWLAGFVYLSSPTWHIPPLILGFKNYKKIFF